MEEITITEIPRSNFLSTEINIKETTKSREKVNIRIVSLEVQEDELIAFLSDGKKSIIPLDWFTKWGIENVTADKLKKHEIRRGKNIYFPEIDEVLGIEKFVNGFDAPCE